MIIVERALADYDFCISRFCYRSYRISSCAEISQESNGDNNVSKEKEKVDYVYTETVPREMLLEKT